MSLSIFQKPLRPTTLSGPAPSSDGSEAESTGPCRCAIWMVLKGSDRPRRTRLQDHTTVKSRREIKLLYHLEVTEEG